VLALLGPSWQRVEQTSLKRSDPLVVALQLSPAMLASDVLPNRLAQAKRKLLDLLQSRRDAQTAIIVFAGSAHTLVPLSDDLATSRNLLDSVNPSIMPQAGQRADLAVALAAELLKQGAQGAGKILLIDSELDQQEQEGIRQALAQHNIQLSILGIGTHEGAPIAIEDGGFVKDAQGAILLPRLDSAGLQQFARQLGGHYASATVNDDDLAQLNLLDTAQTFRQGNEPTQLTRWADQGHWLLLPLLLLAACAGRRGWLLCLPLLLMLPQPSYAFEFADLWLRPDQQGQRLLEEQKPAEAAKRFTNPQWQAQALYQAGDYNAAAERFAQGYSAMDHYNRGNALAKAGELEAAIDAYEQALERQADLAQAKQNRALVEQALQQRQQQQEQHNQQKQDAAKQQDNNDQQQSGSSSSAQQQSAEQSDKSDASSQQQSATKPEQSAAEQSKQQPTDAQDANASNNAAEQAKSSQEHETSKEPLADTGQEQNKTAQSTKKTPTGGRPTPTKDADRSAEDKAAESSDEPTQPALDTEQKQALEQWLRQIPDEPGELLRRKFWYEQQQRQEQSQ
jgi:Ca-activated chloride channel family protein